MLAAFIFQACGIQGQGITAFAFHKIIRLLRGKRRKQFLYQRGQFGRGPAHFQAETPVHFGRGVFQYHRVRDAEQGHHPPVPEQQFRPGMAEGITVCHNL